MLKKKKKFSTVWQVIDAWGVNGTPKLCARRPLFTFTVLPLLESQCGMPTCWKTRWEFLHSHGSMLYGRLLDALENANGHAEATFEVGFPDVVDWGTIQPVYGWSALQYQACARCHIETGGLPTHHLHLHRCAA